MLQRNGGKMTADHVIEELRAGLRESQGAIKPSQIRALRNVASPKAVEELHPDDHHSPELPCRSREPEVVNLADEFSFEATEAGEYSPASLLPAPIPRVSSQHRDLLQAPPYLFQGPLFAAQKTWSGGDAVLPAPVAAEVPPVPSLAAIARGAVSPQASDDDAESAEVDRFVQMTPVPVASSAAKDSGDVREVKGLAVPRLELPLIEPDSGLDRGDPEVPLVDCSRSIAERGLGPSPRRRPVSQRRREHSASAQDAEEHDSSLYLLPSASAVDSLRPSLDECLRMITMTRSRVLEAGPDPLATASIDANKRCSLLQEKQTLSRSMESLREKMRNTQQINERYAEKARSSLTKLVESECLLIATQDELRKVRMQSRRSKEQIEEHREACVSLRESLKARVQDLAQVLRGEKCVLEIVKQEIGQLAHVIEELGGRLQIKTSEVHDLQMANQELVDRISASKNALAAAAGRRGNDPAAVDNGPLGSCIKMLSSLSSSAEESQAVDMDLPTLRDLVSCKDMQLAALHRKIRHLTEFGNGSEPGCAL